jgi:hypothetical protein
MYLEEFLINKKFYTSSSPILWHRFRRGQVSFYDNVSHILNNHYRPRLITESLNH